MASAGTGGSVTVRSPQAGELAARLTARGATVTRLCHHASQMGKAGHRLAHRPRAHDRDGDPPEIRRVERSGTEATVSLDRGQWTMRVLPGMLEVRAEATDEENLRRIQDLLTPPAWRTSAGAST